MAIRTATYIIEKNVINNIFINDINITNFEEKFLHHLFLNLIKNSLFYTLRAFKLVLK